jgi:hypothetical protein
MFYDHTEPVFSKYSVLCFKTTQDLSGTKYFKYNVLCFRITHNQSFFMLHVMFWDNKDP